MSHLIRAAIAVVILFLASDALAQGVSIGTLPKLLFCAGEEVQISYTASGAYTARNSFTVQLSDSNGTFETFQNIGSKRTAELSGEVTAKIPGLGKNGFRYRMRVISSEPYAVSGDNGSNITIGAVPTPQFDEKFRVASMGEVLRFNSTSVNAAAVRWEFGPDATPSSSTSPVVDVSFSSTGYKYATLTAISIGGCEISKTTGKPEHHGYMMTPLVYVASCFPRIPSSASVDSTVIANDERAAAIWIVPGARNYAHPIGAELFVEPGGTLTYLHSFNVVYLKAGAAIEDASEDFLIIREPGASVVNPDPRMIFFECADLEFDYSDAPPYKIEQASVAGGKRKLSAVYPNPANGVVYRVASERVLSARLFSATGQQVLSVIEPNAEPFSVASLPNGLYQLELQFADRRETHKLIVQH